MGERSPAAVNPVRIVIAREKSARRELRLPVVRLRDGQALGLCQFLALTELLGFLCHFEFLHLGFVCIPAPGFNSRVRGEYGCRV